MLARPALCTIIVAHEPPDAREAPGTMPIEAQLAMRPGGVTMRLYGHYHEFSHRPAKLFITGNAGAPLASATASTASSQ
ncbi:MAG: hypothetical protein EPO40_02590 [Myxococcaceae bacterium]|nr:MAG: hypothetical protein EPO40_02590 [Myxococcaceae bacterium]